MLGDAVDGLIEGRRGAVELGTVFAILHYTTLLYSTCVIRQTGANALLHFTVLL